MALSLQYFWSIEVCVVACAFEHMSVVFEGERERERITCPKVPTKWVQSGFQAFYFAIIDDRSHMANGCEFVIQFLHA